MRSFNLTGGVYSHQVRPMMRIEDSGTAKIPQQHHHSLQLWYEDGKMLVLKEKGHREYYNQYNPPFKVPTQFHVFLKVNEMEDGKEVLMEVGVFPLNKEIKPDDISKEVKDG